MSTFPVMSSSGEMRGGAGVSCGVLVMSLLIASPDARRSVRIAPGVPDLVQIHIRAGGAQLCQELFFDEMQLLHPRPVVHAHHQGPILAPECAGPLREL